VGQVAGSLMVSYQFANNPAPLTSVKIASKADPIALPTWNDPTLENSAWRFLNLSATVNTMLGNPPPPVYHLGGELDTNKDNIITADEIAAITAEGVKIGDETYSKADIEEIFVQISRHLSGRGDPSQTPITRADMTEIFGQFAAHFANNGGQADITRADFAEISGQIATRLVEKDIDLSQISVARKDWQAVQMRPWGKILFLPIIVVAVFCAAFLVLGRDPEEPVLEEEKKDNAS